MTMVPSFQLLSALPDDPSREDVLRAVGRAGAVRADRLTVMTHGDEDWRGGIGSVYRLTHTPYGQIVSLCEGGREVFVETFGGRPDYLDRPASVADRAHQAEALRHLQTQFETVDVIRKKQGGLPRPGHDRATTDQILAFRVRPVGSSVTVERAPLLCAIGASAPLTMQAVRRLIRLHRTDVVRWGHPVIIAVPALTPEVVAGMEWLRGKVTAGKLSQFEIPHLVAVPPVTAPRTRSPV